MPAVTIDKIDTFPLRIPLDTWAPSPMFAGRPRTHVEMFLVRVTCSNGIVGWGESYGSSLPLLEGVFDAWVRHLAVGQDPTDRQLTARIERLLHGMGRAGSTVHAISGLDIALWDIRGKIEGVSVSTLLGGAKRKRVETYASLLQYSGNVDHVARNTTRALERGYKHIKLHERTAGAVAASRKAAGPDIPIMVDTNCAWTPAEAEKPVAAMAPSKPKWVEEPIWPPEDFESLAKLRKATGVPLAMGENATGVLDFRKMVAAGATDFVQPSIVKIGGLTQPLAGRHGGREGRRQLHAACVLLRPRLSRDAARHRVQGQDAACWNACSPTSASLPIRRRSRTRTAASTCRIVQDLAPIPRPSCSNDSRSERIAGEIICNHSTGARCSAARPPSLVQHCCRGTPPHRPILSAPCG